ncbi:MAG TPA: hypothetical protein DC054_26000 [Blastocatellia bacterium]|nr:hypothetical protein [Blastocatellia bacterium]
MTRDLLQTFALVVLLSSAVSAAPAIAQSAVVNFPVIGRVTVEAREEVGKFPQMVFTSQRTHEQLLLSSIEDKDKWLIPLADEPSFARPVVRFRVIRARGLRSPMIMAVALRTGGSDNGFCLAMFTEVGGKVRRLNDGPFFTNVQGGYFFGYLNKRFGYGLAVWNFIWDHGPHYTDHKYHLDIYRLRNGNLRRTFQTVSRRTYYTGKGAHALLELGIKAYDQRDGIPNIRDATK